MAGRPCAGPTPSPQWPAPLREAPPSCPRDRHAGELTGVPGPSGSAKSSLVFDTLYAEGQRRYVETFSAYARQFLERMDNPDGDKVQGVPPATAIDPTTTVRY